MKKIILILFLIIKAFKADAQNVNFAWAKQMGGAGANVADGGWSITVDAAGNIYTSGGFSGTVDFNPGPGVYYLTSIGMADIFVSKLDSSGNFIWAKQMGKTGYAYASAIVLDLSGNIYTTGSFDSTVDFDPGPGYYEQSNIGGEGDIFISKLDANGNFVFARQLGGSLGGAGYSIAVDATGNIYTTGYCDGIVDFDPGPGVYDLVTWGTFVSKLNASGNFVWARAITGTGFSEAHSIVLDASGNIYTTGWFTYSIDFDPGPGDYTLNAGGISNFVWKLNASGNFVWAKPMGGSFVWEAASMSLDPSGNIIVAGCFELTKDFDPGPGVFYLVGNSIDIFVSKLDANGNFIWAKQIGGPDWQSANSITTDIAGNIYLTGWFYDIVDFDPGPGVYNLSSVDDVDMFVSKLDANGNFLWAKQMGGGGSGRNSYQITSKSIAVDISGHIYTTGSFEIPIDFDPGINTFNLTPFGARDIFVHKMSSCTNSTVSTITASACSTYTLNGQTYTTTGVYMQTIINAAGCDSIITLNLTINNNRYTTISAEACDSYSWNSQTYTSSGTYRDTLPAANGCDSIITLNLVINSTSFSTINASICSGQNYLGYTISGTYIDTLIASNSCDSIRTLNLTVKPKSFSTINASICQGQNYLGYTVSGTYIDTLIATNSCDSIRNLILALKSISYTTIDTSICKTQNYFGHTTSGTYVENFLASNGCDSVRTLHLSIKNNCIPFAIPNAFTPNKDGLNDVFKPIFYLPIQQYHMLIYNRYGQKIFETNNYMQGWNGVIKGQQQEIGTFIYIINLKTSLGEKYERKGAFMLLR